VAFVGEISNVPLALPIANTFFAVEIDAKIDRFKDHIFGSSLRPDHVVEQAVVAKVSLERRQARESFFLESFPKRTPLFIRHGLSVVGHNTIALKGSQKTIAPQSMMALLSKYLL
jgi:hypothetical protein